MSFRNWVSSSAALCAAMASGAAVTAEGAGPRATASRDAGAPRDASAAAEASVWFEPNLGQSAPEARMVGRARGLVALLTADGAVVSGPSGVLGLRVPGAAGRVVALEPRRGRSRYYTGNDASKWLRDVPHHGSALLDEALPGIDVRWRGDAGDLRFDVEVAPGADAAAFRLALDGADRATIDGAGRLVVELGGARTVISAPVAWQERRGGREALVARWVPADGGAFGFEVRGRDPSARLVIDPSVHAGSLIGTTSAETGTRCATDVTGALFLCGSTASATFPAQPATGPKSVVQTATGETTGSTLTDGFVAKFTPDGTAVDWVTYLGGQGSDAVAAMKIASNGDVVVCGGTAAANFPTASPVATSGAGFLARLSPDATSLVRSTYVTRSARRFDFDAAGNVFVLSEGAPSTVVKYDSGVTAALWTVQLTPTTGTIIGQGLVVDAAGDPWIVGYTNSNTSLSTSGAYDTSFNGGTNDALLWRFASSNGSRTYTSFFGGSGEDRGEDLTTDRAGRLLVCGWTTSTGFPTAGAAQPSNAGGRDAFVMAVDPLQNTTAQLIWSTYFGGGGTDTGRAIVVGPWDDVYVAGDTQSTTGFPLASAFQGTHAGGTNDAFAAKFSSAGATQWSTYVGGLGDDTCGCVTIGPTGRPTLAGQTTSAPFVVPSGAWQTSHLGAVDAFVVAIEESTTPFGDVSLAALATEGTETAGYNLQGGVLPLTGGSQPLTWALHAGALPSGLTLYPGGYVAGTPAVGTGGLWRFAARVKDSVGATAVREYELRIYGPPVVTTSVVPAWTIGEPIDFTLSATGGRAPLSWRLTDQSADALPESTAIDVTGIVTGTPASFGDHTFVLEVRDINGASSSRTVTWRVNDRPMLDELTFEDCTETTVIGRDLTRTGGTAPFTWILEEGPLPVSPAPPSFTPLSPTTGRLSGFARPAGDYPFTVAIRDGAGAVERRSYTMHVNAAAQITTDVLPPALEERPYGSRMVATGGTGAYRWLTTGVGRFPIGFALDGATGGLRGRPLLAGEYSFDVRVVDDCDVAIAEPVAISVVPYYSLADAKRNAVVDEFAEDGLGTPVTRFIELLAGSRLDGTFRLVGRGKLRARIRFVDVATGAEVDLSKHLKTRGSKVTLSKFTVTETRRFFVVVEPEADFVGKVETNLRAKATTAFKGTAQVDPEGVPAAVVIQSIAGSRLAVTVARAKRSAALPTIVSVKGEDGVELLDETEVKATKTGATLKLARTLPVGEVTILFAPSFLTEAGACTWSAKLSPPRGYDVRLYDIPVEYE